MDFSLHSFILVIGLMVIAFIVFDGIKKVREAKANQLDQDIDLLSESDSLMMGSEDYSHLDDLEIADDLLTNAFDSHSSVSSESVDSKLKSEIEGETESVSTVESDELDRPAASEEVQSFPEKHEPIEISEALAIDEEIVEVHEEVVQAEPVETSSVFQVIDEDVDALESFSVNGEIEVEAVDETTNVIKPQKPSKAEMMAKAIEAERLAREAQEEEIEVEEPQVEVSDKEPVPVLMEPVELGKQVDPNPPIQQELHLPEFVQQTLNEEPEEILTAQLDEPDIETFDMDDDVALMEAAVVKPVQEKVGERLADRPAAQEIFVINVIKESEPMLQGAELNHIFKVCDMRFGEMDIFHRFEQANAQGKIQFSVVNAVAPGKFDLNTIDEIETPGISLFMSLPGPENPMEAFDAMAEVALVFSRNFNANLYDESHSDLTPQTLEHYRHRIREYSRKQVVKK